MKDELKDPYYNREKVDSSYKKVIETAIDVENMVARRKTLKLDKTEAALRAIHLHQEEIEKSVKDLEKTTAAMQLTNSKNSQGTKEKEGSSKSVSIVEPRDDLHFGNRGRQQNSNGSRPKYQNSSRERDRSRSTDRSGGSHNNSRNNSPNANRNFDNQRPYYSRPPTPHPNDRNRSTGFNQWQNSHPLPSHPYNYQQSNYGNRPPSPFSQGRRQSYPPSNNFSSQGRGFNRRNLNNRIQNNILNGPNRPVTTRPIVCWNCNRQGHRFAECRSLRQRSAPIRGSMKN